MSKAIIFVVDDDPQVLRAVTRDLRQRYRSDYRIISSDSGREALEAITQLKNKGDEVALLLSDQKMPELNGVDFLETAKKTYPNAKRVLLTAYSDTNAAIKAINDVQLDYYLLKPWDPPEERLYPVVDDILDDWLAAYKPPFSGLRVVGYQYSPKSHKLKDFLSGNLFPYQWLDIDSNPVAKEIGSANRLEVKDYPAVLFNDGSLLKNPDVPAIAEKLGLQPKSKASTYDVVIIGAGPAGLAAGVYGGSEGLDTLLIEKRAPGGQAGTSSRIENYLGFPKGLSGQDLARRAITQATRFGIEFLSPTSVEDLSTKDQYKEIKLNTGDTIHTKTVIIATGVDYRKLDTPGIADFTGAGVYYGAATTEAHACKNEDVYIVGGGNSAGQAAMYLSNYAKNVFILIRKPDLSGSMSHYLIEQLNHTENIQVLAKSEICQARGSDRLEQLAIKNLEDDTVKEVEAKALFIFIGARPFTDWIQLPIIRDEKGFLVTGRELLSQDGFAQKWKLDREPFLLETSVPGIFAAGDVRSGAMNRVAAAVGEGSMAISLVHRYLAEN